VSGKNGSGSYEYADDAKFRAWGALKHLEYGNDVEMNATAFNSRLQATGFEVKKNGREMGPCRGTQARRTKI